MAQTPSTPADCMPSEDSLQLLDAILCRAFGVKGGYQELNGITIGAAHFNLYEQLSADDKPMGVLIPNLRLTLMAQEGQAAACLKLAYQRLIGNAELRDWIAAHCPAIAPLVPLEQFETARAEYEADRLFRRVGGVRQTLEQLVPRTHIDNEGKRLASAMMDRLDDLTDYKTIHDTLHHLQMEVLNELGRITQTDILPAERQLSVPLQLAVIDAACGKIAGCFVRPSAPHQAVIFRTSVTDEVKGIAAMLKMADSASSESVGVAAGLLRTLLRVQMVLFDNLLVGASEQIPFAKFAAFLRGLPQPEPSGKGGGDPELFSNVSRNFEDIELRLVRRRSIHRHWQKVEATILNIEELVRGVGREKEYEFHWANLVAELGEIATLSSDPSVLEMIQIPGLAPADNALRSPAWNTAFAMFSRMTRAQFQVADIALLNDCGQLKELNQPLSLFFGE